MNSHFTLARWGSNDQWKCNHCAFDTLEGEDVMLEHLFKRHRELFMPEPAINPSPVKKARGKNHRRSK